ncbi:MAG: Rab family GTPase, partial [Pseudomonadota bacterium]
MKKKICMLGAFAVGKTSLVQQFAHGLFSERYLSTIGVRVEKKALEVGGTPVELLVWDLHGEDDFQTVRTSYVRGAAGCLYVVDGTRRETLDVALELRDRIEAEHPALPSMLLLNKR